jgi:hypothetical protein
MRQTVLGHALEIGSGVVAGERVVLAAQARHDLGEFAGRDLFRGLEHQMLEEMGDAGDARRLVRRADAVPHHVGHHGRAIVGHHNALHAVGQRELADAGAALCEGDVRRECDHGEESHQKGCEFQAGRRPERAGTRTRERKIHGDRSSSSQILSTCLGGGRGHVGVVERHPVGCAL